MPRKSDHLASSNYSSFDDREAMATVNANTPHDIDDDHTFKSTRKSGFQMPDLMPAGGILSSAVNMAQAAIGAGTLGFSAALKDTGVGLGLIFSVIFCVMTIYSVRLLCICMDKTGLVTYEELAAELIHPKMKKVFGALILFFFWGITILYVIALGDILHPLTDSAGFPDWCHGVEGRRAVVSIFWVVCMLPLSLLKEMNSLRFSSFLGLVTVFVLMVAIMYHAEADNASFKTVTWFKFDIDMVIALPTICFSYNCQALSFEVYHEMKPRTLRRMTLSTGSAMISAGVVYLCCGVWGYMDFGDAIKGNILRNYADPSASAYLMAAFIGMGITITFSFPVCIVPTRDSLLQMMGYKDVYHTPSLVRIGVAGFIALSSLVVGLYVENISIMFNLLGGICGSLVCFILPATLALRSGDWDVAHVGWVNMFLTYLLIVGGGITLVLGTIVGCIQNF